MNKVVFGKYGEMPIFGMTMSAIATPRIGERVIYRNTAYKVIDII